MTSRKITVSIASLIFAINISPLAHGVTFTWDGGSGTTDNWTDGDNWDPNGAPSAGADLLFGTAGAARKTTSTNDFTAGTGFESITFNNTSGFTLSGNAILLGCRRY